MIPHGDRRNRAMSGGAENEEQSILFRGDDVVRVFVLGNGFKKQNRRLLPVAPRGELLQCAESRQRALQFGESLCRQIRSIDDLHTPQCRAPRKCKQRAVFFQSQWWLAALSQTESVAKLRRVNQTTRSFPSKIFRLALLFAFLAAVCVLVWIVWRWMQPPPPFANIVTLGYVESPVRSYHEPFGVAADEKGNIYFSESTTGRVYRIAAGSYQNGTPPQAAVVAENLETPSALVLDHAGNLVVANTGAHTIVRIDPKTKSVTTVAGASGISGDSDGKDARFNGPVGVAIGKDGSIFVADTYNDRIRVIAPDGQVRTLAGGSTPGFADGSSADARFDTPCGVAIATDGSLIIADTGNHRIRRVTPDGQVTTIAGTGEADEREGSPVEAAFNEPTAIAIRDKDSFYVADAGGSAIRLISLKSDSDAKPFVKTEFPQAQFRRPAGLAMLPGGELIFADSSQSLIRAFVPAGSKLGFEAEARSMDLFSQRMREMVPARWPFDPPDVRRDIAGTFGEVRGERLPDHDAWFHNGLDIPGAYGELARAIFTERVTRPLSVESVGSLRERVRLPLFGYIHVRIGRDQKDQLLPNFAGGAVAFRRDAQGQITGVRLRRGTLIKAGDAIGALNRLNHVHLIAGPSGNEVNALRVLNLPGLKDTISPIIEKISILAENGDPVFDSTKAGKGQKITLPAGRYRIIVRAYDQADGNPSYRRLGVYMLKYEFLNDSQLKRYGFVDTADNITFDRLPRHFSDVGLIYAQGSQSGYQGVTVFDYIVTNYLSNGEASEGWLDTKGHEGEEYTLRIIAMDYFLNSTLRDLRVVVPKIN